MGERRAPAGALDSLLKLIPTKNNKNFDGRCDFCHERTDPPHVYLTCPERPCYLCRTVGHTQTECPYRDAPGAAESALKALLASRSRRSMPLFFAAAAELGTAYQTQLMVRSAQYDAKIVAAVRKANVKRITAMDFLPETPCRRVLSADKSGTVVMWDFGLEVGGGLEGKRKFAQDTASGKVHRCNINSLQFSPDRGTLYTSAADGFLRSTALDRLGSLDASDSLLNLNPDGWTGDVKAFRMVYGMCGHSEAQGSVLGACLTAGDDKGTMYTIDPRATDPVCSSFRAHKDKIQHMEANPGNGVMLVSTSNDRTVRLWDARRLSAETPLGVINLSEGGSVTGATFSPRTGTKLLVTAQPNKLLLWNDVNSLAGCGGETGKDAPPAPDVDIMHAHQFNRYLTNSKAAWDSKDMREETFLCGRFLGEAFVVADETVLLHPVDIFSAKSGELVASLVDGSVKTVCCVRFPRFRIPADFSVLCVYLCRAPFFNRCLSCFFLFPHDSAD